MFAASVILFVMALYATSTLVCNFIMMYFQLVAEVSKPIANRARINTSYALNEIVAVVLWTLFFAVRVYP